MSNEFWAKPFLDSGKVMRVAVAGATGHLGRKILEILSEQNYPIVNVVALGSKKSGAISVSYGELGILPALQIDSFNFASVELVIIAVPDAVAEDYIEIARCSGCIVIDCSSYGRNTDEIPLLVPEINADAIKAYEKSGIIACPSAMAVQLALVLAPLHKEGVIKRAVVSTYQATSISGKYGMDELYTQTKQGFSGPSMAYSENQNKPKAVFAKRIAFNCIPQIGELKPCGNTTYEESVADEIKRVICPNINISITCVILPMFVGDGAAINVEFEKEMHTKIAESILRNTYGTGVITTRNHLRYLTPIECAHEDIVSVSRIRKDETVANGLSMWAAADSVRRGIALNAVQILALLTEFLMYGTITEYHNDGVLNT